LRRPRWERLLFAIVAVLLVASVVVTVLVIVFGVFVESSGA
jgi:ABC-type multidrug transport system permease subunit